MAWNGRTGPALAELRATRPGSPRKRCLNEERRRLRTEATGLFVRFVTFVIFCSKIGCSKTQAWGDACSEAARRCKVNLMPHVPGLRSPYARVGRVVFFGRMLDKIRLHAAGKLPPEYQANLGEPRPNLFDARCCRFLGVPYTDLQKRTLAGGTDEEILAWAEQHGTKRTDDECNVWNRFMVKLGWRDDRSEALRERVAECGLTGKPIETFFDFIDVDEGRDPVRTRAWELRPAAVVVLMGVAGSGKTTVGLRLAEALGWRFNDADDFHPVANIAKMTSGTPLNDTDRAPWLEAIREHIASCLRSGESAVVTCSALKERYRHAIGTQQPAVKLVHLHGSPELIAARMQARSTHFMKPEMLESQLAALEAPSDALVVDVAQPPEAIVAKIRETFKL